MLITRCPEIGQAIMVLTDVLELVDIHAKKYFLKLVRLSVPVRADQERTGNRYPSIYLGQLEHTIACQD